MKNWKTYAPFALGFAPLLFGELQHLLFMWAWDTHTSFAFGPFALVFAGLWCALGFLSGKLTGKALPAILLLNLPSLFFLILAAIQEWHGYYWFHIMGRLPQLFFLSLLTWGTRLCMMLHISEESALNLPYFCATFLLMLALSAAGCCLHKKVFQG